VRIGELAELAGVTTDTIRHYHRIGLLPEPARERNGYRTYGVRDAVRLVRARHLVGLGWRLRDVADALAFDEGRDLREILDELRADLARHERRIAEQRRRVESLLARDDFMMLPGEMAHALSAGERGPGIILL
jgi:DNA-binding transcriptional MerR regulator